MGSKAEWLLGSWVSEQKDKQFIESWKKISDSVFQGEGLNKNNKTLEILNKESMQLIQMQQQVFFIAKVAHNPLPVAFKLINCDNGNLVFHNPDHDFPKTIQYENLSSGQFLATVSDGNTDASGQSFQLKFKKSNPSNKTLEQKVRAFVDAYNQKDLDKMISLTHTKIRWMSVQGENISIETQDQTELKSAMKAYFSKDRKTHSSLSHFSTNGLFVSVLEKASRMIKNKVKAQCSHSIYEFEDGLILNVWYHNAQTCS